VNTNMGSGEARTDSELRRQLTLPIVLGCLRSQKLTLVFLLIASVFLGIVPALKSEIEASVLDQISRCIREPEVSCSPSAQLERFRERSASAEGGIVEQISIWAFSGMTAATALGAFFIVAAAAALLQWGSYTFSSGISAEIFTSLRNRALRNSLATDTHQIESVTNAPGQFSNAIQQGAASVTEMYTDLIRSGQDIFAIGTVLILLAAGNPWFALFCLTMVLIQIGLSLLQARQLRSRREAFDRNRNALLASTDDILSKREIIAAYEQQDRYAGRIHSESQEFAKQTRRMNIIESLYNNISALITDYGRILVLFGAVGIYYFFDRDKLSSVGDAYFFVSIYARLLAPATNLVNRYEQYRRSRDTSRRFLRILGAEGSGELPATVDPQLHASWSAGSFIRFDHVAFQYPASTRRVLDGCSFIVPARRTTLLLGPSGCGKSTIARILLGFWRHDKGNIHIGGADIRAFSSVELRERMSYVAQGDYIVDETVRENLLWVGEEGGIADGDLRYALEKVGLGQADILEKCARDLSLGQQQRLSIARMMLDHSEIVIMDEPMAGVDLTTLGHVLPPLRTLLTSREHTVLIISHRLSFAALADHVVLMDKFGTVVEEGAPQELKATGGTFSQLFGAAQSELIAPDDAALRKQ
jgi:ATP-binding cassette, subfamily C, bacterial CydC